MNRDILKPNRMIDWVLLVADAALFVVYFIQLWFGDFKGAFYSFIVVSLCLAIYALLKIIQMQSETEGTLLGLINELEDSIYRLTTLLKQKSKEKEAKDEQV